MKTINIVLVDDHELVRLGVRHLLGERANVTDAASLNEVRAHLAAAPVVRPIPAPRGGRVVGMNTRDIGLVIVELGGGRRLPGDALKPTVSIR